MNIEQMLAVLDPDIVSRLKTAVEIGKWPNGIVLTQEQRQICMQAVIEWEGHKEEGEECDSHVPEPEFKPIRFV